MIKDSCLPWGGISTTSGTTVSKNNSDQATIQIHLLGSGYGLVPHQAIIWIKDKSVLCHIYPEAPSGINELYMYR